MALHRLTSELGLADSMPLLEVADPDQVRSLIDLNVWKQSRVDLSNLLDWSVALAQLQPEKAAAHLRQLDDELLGYLLRCEMEIYLAGGDDIPGEPEGVFYSSTYRKHTKSVWGCAAGGAADEHCRRRVYFSGGGCTGAAW